MPQMTVLEILNRTKVFFEKKGVPDPLLDAQYIISHGLKMKSRMEPTGNPCSTSLAIQASAGSPSSATHGL